MQVVSIKKIYTYKLLYKRKAVRSAISFEVL